MNDTPAPNRLLDLDELQSPFFASVFSELDELNSHDQQSYLHPSKRWEYPWALSRAGLEPNSRVLDAGCGASIFPIYLAKGGHRVSALDLRPPFGLDRSHSVEIDYCAGELTRVPYADESFDAVFCISVIEHLGHAGTSLALHAGAPLALAELRRVVKIGGRILLTTDFYEDADTQLFYYKDGERFPVDWGFSDALLLDRYLLSAPGLKLDGELDLIVDWRETARRMQAFPFTAMNTLPWDCASVDAEGATRLASTHDVNVCCL